MKTNRYLNIKNWYFRKYYEACLTDTLVRIDNGECGLTLAKRFFSFKIYCLRKR